MASISTTNGLSNDRRELVSQLKPLLLTVSRTEKVHTDIAARLGKLADLTERVMMYYGTVSLNLLPAKLHEAASLHYSLAGDMDEANKQMQLYGFLFTKAFTSGFCHSSIDRTLIEMQRKASGLSLEKTLGHIEEGITETKTDALQVERKIAEIFPLLFTTEVLSKLRTDPENAWHFNPYADGVIIKPRS